MSFSWFKERNQEVTRPKRKVKVKFRRGKERVKIVGDRPLSPVFRCDTPGLKEPDVTLQPLPRLWNYTSYFNMNPHGEFALQYLGSTVLAKATSSGLGTIQKPLRETYFEYKKASGKKGKNKELKEVGLQVSDHGVAIIFAGSHPGSELFYDMQSISFFEAVKFTTIKGADKRLQGGFVPIDISRSPNTGSEKLFAPLDKKQYNLAKFEHPALLALVMRKNTGVRALECHGFICENEEEALRIASLIGMVQSRNFEPARPEYVRQDSEPRFEGPPGRRPDLLQPSEFDGYRGGLRQTTLSDEHFRGSRRPDDWESEQNRNESDLYMGNAPREPYSPRQSGRYDNRFPPSYDDEVRYRHNRYPSNEFSSERPASNEYRHSSELRASVEYRHERQPSNELRHERQPSTEYRHERQPSSEYKHERQASSEFRHERHPSNEYRPAGGDYFQKGDNRNSREDLGRSGRQEFRQPEDYRIPRVLSPGRVPPTTAPKPSKALSPGQISPREDRYSRNDPSAKRGLPRTPTDEPQISLQNRPPSFKGPEYSASSLESRQEMENQRNKPVARVPPHLVAGIKVLPTGFQAALQKKQEERKSPRSPKQERYAEEDPYDNAISRKEFYERESSKKYERDFHSNAPPDIVPQDERDRNWNKDIEPDYNDYDRVIIRDHSGYNQNQAGQYRYSAPPDEHTRQKQWSYDEQFQKYAQDKDRARSTSAYEVQSHDSSGKGSGGYKHGEFADMFSKMNMQNQNKNPEVLDTAGTNFEQSLGYFP